MPKAMKILLPYCFFFPSALPLPIMSLAADMAEWQTR